jgi:hypothetical protein
LQEDIFYALMSRQELLSVNVKQFRKMVIQAEIDMKLVYLTVRNGKSGAGILVEMPTLTVNKPNVSGPVLEVDFSVLVMEQPTINMTAASGTLLSAEEICLLVAETLHHLSLGTGSLRAMPNAITPATEYRGVVAYRCHVGFTSATAPMPRTRELQIVNTSGSVAISCSNDPTAEIRYTLDGTLPASGNGGNPQSKAYQSPITVASGTTIRACAYAAGKIGSSIATLTIP